MRTEIINAAGRSCTRDTSRQQRARKSNRIDLRARRVSPSGWYRLVSNAKCHSTESLSRRIVERGKKSIWVLINNLRIFFGGNEECNGVEIVEKSFKQIRNKRKRRVILKKVFGFLFIFSIGIERIQIVDE